MELKFCFPESVQELRESDEAVFALSWFNAIEVEMVLAIDDYYFNRTVPLVWAIAELHKFLRILRQGVTGEFIFAAPNGTPPINFSFNSDTVFVSGLARSSDYKWESKSAAVPMGTLQDAIKKAARSSYKRLCKHYPLFKKLDIRPLSWANETSLDSRTNEFEA